MTKVNIKKSQTRDSEKLSKDWEAALKVLYTAQDIFTFDNDCTKRGFMPLIKIIDALIFACEEQDCPVPTAGDLALISYYMTQARDHNENAA